MIVNGEQLELGQLAGRSPGALISHLALDPRSVALERNGAIVPRATWETVQLEESDQIELIRFVGGG